MEQLAYGFQAMFSDLIQRCVDAGFSADYPEAGNFVRVPVRGREYWYFEGPRTKEASSRARKYVGPVGDPEIDKRVANFKELKPAYRERRQLVSALRNVGLPAPEPFVGELVDALWRGGLFRLRGVAIGTLAFQTYAGLLGTRFPSAASMTADVDFAQFHSISVSVNDTMDNILDTLRRVDPTFREIPNRADSRLSSAFINSRGFKVEFLTPNTSKDDYSSQPAVMPALGGAAAHPLRFLDFLIYQPVRSVLLHKAGIALLVPAPERYAIHKLIIATQRRNDENGRSKSRKDVLQASLLIEAMDLTGQSIDLGLAWMEGWNRGPGWRERLSQATPRLSEEHAKMLREAIATAKQADQQSASTVG